MRESNFSFPATNRAAVCITSHLYDRRALDTTSPLPLFNTLSHLTTLSSTSPRIREILVMDGGLERIVKILRDFCTNPPPPEPPTQFYGLLPPSAHPSHPRQLPTTPPIHDPKRPFDRAAAYRFSLALQCLVNIGVRGSEFIRARVVQAGTLDVIGCILEAWLMSKGISVHPSASLTGLPRESREVRNARKHAAHEMRNQDDALLASFTSLPNARVSAESSNNRMEEEDGHSAGTSNNASPTTTPVRSSSPTDETTFARARRQSAPAEAGPSTVRPTTVRQDPETESDADVEMEDASASESVTQPEAGPPQVDIIEPDNIDMILSGVGEVVRNNQITVDINMDMDRMDDLGTTMDRPGMGGVRDLGTNMRDLGIAPENREAPEDMTPRATLAPLPDTRTLNLTQRQIPPPAPLPHARLQNPPRHPNPNLQPMTRFPAGMPISAVLPSGPRPPPPHDAGPYREEDVLLSLQLLAYLSKYPHVRQAFYKPRQVFNHLLQHSMHATPPAEPAAPSSSANTFKTSLPSSCGKEKARPATSDSALPSSKYSLSLPKRATPSLTQSTNIFSLVERFTFRPSPTEINMSPMPPMIPGEIQHWAGVVMRNACRKDESRGGIRQCANVQCGKWETFPREFAKCRRCRKAKYCGKDCQSRAWSEGHRFWCSAKEEEAEGGGEGDTSRRAESSQGNTVTQQTSNVTNTSAPRAAEETGSRPRVDVARNVHRPPPTWEVVQAPAHVPPPITTDYIPVVPRRAAREPRNVFRAAPTWELAQPSIDSLMQRAGIPPPAPTMFFPHLTAAPPRPPDSVVLPAGSTGQTSPLFRTAHRPAEPASSTSGLFLQTMRGTGSTGGNPASPGPSMSAADHPGQSPEQVQRNVTGPASGPWTFGPSFGSSSRSGRSSTGSID